MTGSDMVPGLCQVSTSTYSHAKGVTAVNVPEQTAATQLSTARESHIFKDAEMPILPAQDDTIADPTASKEAMRKDPTNFITLPRELRDIIYELATLHFEAYPRPKQHLMPFRANMTEGTMASASNSLNSGLLLASRQIFGESVVPYLQNTLFTFQDVDPAVCWFKSIPIALRPALGHIRLEVLSETFVDRSDPDDEFLCLRTFELKTRAAHLTAKSKCNADICRICLELVSGVNRLTFMTQVVELENAMEEQRYRSLTWKWVAHEEYG